MKKIELLLILLFATIHLFSQNVGIGTSTPNASAAVDIQNTSKGILIPRMTTAQRNAIASAATGLLVFDNTTGSFWFKSSSNWVELVDTMNNAWKKNGTHTYTNGNVGIGTSTPSYNLHINRANASLGFTDTDDNTFSGSITADSTDLVMISARALIGGTPGNLLLQTNSGLAVGGNVGIGTKNPVEKLDVAGGIRFSGNLNRTLTDTANLVPVAYGFISSLGDILKGTGNFTVSLTGSPSKYTITIPSVAPFANATIVVTPAFELGPFTHAPTLITVPVARQKPGTSDFEVFLWGLEDEVGTAFHLIIAQFSFVVYLP